MVYGRRMHTIPVEIQDEFSISRLKAMHEEMHTISTRVIELQTKMAQKSKTYIAMKERHLLLERKRAQVTESLEAIAHKWPIAESSECRNLKRSEELVTEIQKAFPRFRDLIVKWTWKEITPEEQLELTSVNEKINHFESERRALNPTLSDLMIEAAQKHYESPLSQSGNC